MLASAVFATMALDIIAPGPGPLIQPLSAFAPTALAGPWKWIVEATALGVCLVALTAYQRDADSPFVALLAVAGGSLAVSGVVVTDPWFPWERAPTPTGWVHIGAVLITMTAFSAAMVLRSRSRALLAIMVIWCASLAIGRRGSPPPRGPTRRSPGQTAR
ncbi:DUF998 domain-containing protein [Gemmatimonas sp.]|uniref:DUF998 domain-containing protein n=1 Tax=Gemmatimonas sp. TaxID=1962908 RepID=UPI00356A51A9